MIISHTLTQYVSLIDARGELAHEDLAHETHRQIQQHQVLKMMNQADMRTSDV